MPSTATKISSSAPGSINFGIWWDGDLLRELLDHVGSAIAVSARSTSGITKAAGSSTCSPPDGTESNNGTKGNPSLQADIFGDWREEVIWRTADSTALRIYTTTDLTEHKIYTLMHDPVYRLGVAWQNVGYNQPPAHQLFPRPRHERAALAGDLLPRRERLGR